MITPAYPCAWPCVADAMLSLGGGFTASAQVVPAPSTTKGDEPSKLEAFEVVVFINSTSRLENGDFIPPRDGAIREAGLKTELFDNRITATASISSTHYKNWAVSRTGGITPGFTNNVFDLIRDSYIKGWDFSLAARPTPGWQLMVNYAEQASRIHLTDTHLPASFRGSWGVFTTCQFTAEPLKKVRVGGDANRIHDRITSATLMTLRDGRTASAVPGASGSIKLEDGTMRTGFVEYRSNRRWQLKFNVNNVLAETFIVGSQHTTPPSLSEPAADVLVDRDRETLNP